MNSAAKNVRALIVDDNPLVRDLMVRGLEPICDVSVATDGADALLQAVDDPPDLIVADFKMAGLDGRQLCEKLHGRAATRLVPFIFVASRGDIEEKLRPLVMAEDFLAKPFFVSELVRLVKKVVDRVRLEKLQKRATRPGVIQGKARGDGRHRADAILRDGAKNRAGWRCGGASSPATCIFPRDSARTRSSGIWKAMPRCSKPSIGRTASLRSILALPRIAPPRLARPRGF